MGEIQPSTERSRIVPEANKVSSLRELLLEVMVIGFQVAPLLPQSCALLPSPFSLHTLFPSKIFVPSFLFPFYLLSPPPLSSPSSLLLSPPLPLLSPLPPPLSSSLLPLLSPLPPPSSLLLPLLSPLPPPLSSSLLLSPPRWSMKVKLHWRSSLVQV